MSQNISCSLHDEQLPSRAREEAVALTTEQPLAYGRGSEALTDYSDDGVDLTLIRCMLSMTPAERLEFHDSQMAAIEAIRKLNAR